MAIGTGKWETSIGLVVLSDFISATLRGLSCTDNCYIVREKRSLLHCNLYWRYAIIWQAYKSDTYVAYLLGLSAPCVRLSTFAVDRVAWQMPMLVCTIVEAKLKPVLAKVHYLSHLSNVKPNYKRQGRG